MTSKLIKICGPIQILLAGLTYTLGAGIAHYLGYPINYMVFVLGMLASITLQASAYLFSEFFRLPLAPVEPDETPRQREKFRVTLLQVSYAAFTLSFAIILSLLFAHSINLYAGTLFVLIILFLMAYAIPPLRLAAAGYGELVLAVFLGTFLPALSFLLQSGTFHRLLSFTTFPLTLLALAYLLTWDFPTFATDHKLARPTLLTRLTWQRAIPIHNILILLAFLIFSSAPLLNIPWVMIWPVFLVLPFAAVQVYWLQRISTGGRTLWNFLTALSVATFGLSAYLLTMTFWIR